MALRFLQAEEDVIAFANFLYDQGCYIARSGGKLEGVLLDRQEAINALISDLVISMHGTDYWIITIIDDHAYIVLDMVSCSRWSHPRFMDRIARYSGSISHCYGREKTEPGEKLLKSIRRFFKENYMFKHCQKEGRECSFFGPHYQKIDEEYAQNPEPAWLCPGYLRIVCPSEYLETVTQRMEAVIAQYPAIAHGVPVRKYARDHKEHMEVYMGILCDRREFGLQELIELVDRLGYAPGRGTGHDEKAYLKADTAYRNRKYLDVKWNAYGFVENAFKSLGKPEP